MYYHVKIECENGRILYGYDYKRKEEIINDLLIPHLMGNNFFFSGTSLLPGKELRFTIKESPEVINVVQEKEHERRQRIPGLIDLRGLDNRRIFNGENFLTDITREIFYEAQKLIEAKVTYETSVQPTILQDKTKVFIVHGHDNEAKEQVARFIEKLGLEAIILHEQVNQGKTIIEKIEANSDVGFAVILYTACDVGGKNSQELKARARQNVVLEHGYMIAKIGRANVCALVKGNVETPSDIDGIVYTPMDSAGKWQTDLAREIKISGYDIDMNKVF